MKVFLGGEGRSELGHFDGGPAGERGVVEALLTRACGVPVEIVGAMKWDKIPKYRAGEKRGAEQRNVLGLVAKARAQGADIVAFVRDRDGYPEREREVEDAIADAPKTIADCPRVVGGVPVEKLEAWILALKGRPKTESISRSKVKATAEADGVATVVDMVDIAAAADLDAIPADAESLHRWLARARSLVAER